MQRWLTHTVVSGSWGHSKKADLELRGRGHLIWALRISKWSEQGNRGSHIEALRINEAGGSGGYKGDFEPLAAPPVCEPPFPYL